MKKELMKMIIIMAVWFAGFACVDFTAPNISIYLAMVVGFALGNAGIALSDLL